MGLVFPAASRGLYELQHQAQLRELRAGRRLVQRMAPTGVAATFDVDQLVDQIAAAQLLLARAAALATTASLAEQGAHVPALALPDPASAVGVLAPPEGGSWLVDVEESAQTIARRLDEAARSGTTLHALRQAGALAVDRLVTTAIADSARMVSSVEVAARPRVQYVRQLVLPSCPRCMQLAGKIFRWNQGFQRHPSCDCQHVPTMARTFEEAAEQGLAASPYDLFNEMSVEQQDRYFGRFNAQAIRDGADFHQVVNATSARGRPGGRARASLTTTEGTTKRSQWMARRGGFRPRARLTPEGIYRQAEQWGLDRRGALGMLERHGYILPEGQVPAGALRPSGQLGFGQFGRGGTRKIASGAVLDANATGVRDPLNVYTMTAAERRVYEARRNYELALGDIHPGSDLAVHMRGGARISWDTGQVTPKDLAGFEQEWRLQVMARGELTAYRALRRDLDRVLIPRTLDFSDIPADVLDAAHAARVAGQALPREFYQARQAKLAARSGSGDGVGAGAAGGRGRSGGADAGGGRGALPPTGAGAGGVGGPPRGLPPRSPGSGVPMEPADGWKAAGARSWHDKIGPVYGPRDLTAEQVEVLLGIEPLPDPDRVRGPLRYQFYRYGDVVIRPEFFVKTIDGIYTPAGRLVGAHRPIGEIVRQEKHTIWPQELPAKQIIRDLRNAFQRADWFFAEGALWAYDDTGSHVNRLRARATRHFHGLMVLNNFDPVNGRGVLRLHRGLVDQILPYDPSVVPILRRGRLGGGMR